MPHAKPSVNECFRADPDACRVLPEQQKVEGRESLVLTRQRGTCGDRWYVDAERDCPTLRYVVLVREHRRMRIDVATGKGEKSGWVPTGLSGPTCL